MSAGQLESAAASRSAGVSRSQPESAGASRSAGVSRSQLESAGVSRSQPESAGVSRSQPESAGVSWSQPESAGVSRSQPESAGVTGVSRSQPESAGVSWSQPESAGVSRSQPESAGVSRSAVVSRSQPLCFSTLPPGTLNFLTSIFWFATSFFAVPQVAGPGGGFLSFWTRFRTDFRRFVDSRNTGFYSVFLFSACLTASFKTSKNLVNYAVFNLFYVTV